MQAAMIPAHTTTATTTTTSASMAIGGRGGGGGGGDKVTTDALGAPTTTQIATTTVTVARPAILSAPSADAGASPGPARISDPAAENGMQVPYDILPDQWGGLGVFPAQDVAAGTLIWDFAKANKKEYSNEEAKAICLRLKRDDMAELMEFHKVCYFHTDEFILVDLRRDDGRYFNHTNGPKNVALGSVINERLGEDKYTGDDLRSTFAIADILAGAEFLDDYNTYGDSPQWYTDMLHEHGVSEAYMQ